MMSLDDSNIAFSESSQDGSNSMVLSQSMMDTNDSNLTNNEVVVQPGVLGGLLNGGIGINHNNNNNNNNSQENDGPTSRLIGSVSGENGNSNNSNNSNSNKPSAPNLSALLENSTDAQFPDNYDTNK